MPIQIPSGLSFTALQTAAERAAESARKDAFFQDPFASAMLNMLEDEAGRVVTLEGRTIPFPRLSSDMQWLFNSYVSLRTHYLDQKLLAASREGVSQVVSLASGMDGRAYRLAWAQDTTVYELDKAELLTFKHEVARRAKLPATARLVQVPANLQEDWCGPLQDAGFRPERPTLWLVEGILQYLETYQANRLIETLSAMSVAGSRLVTVYFVGDHLKPAYDSGHDRADDFIAYAKVAYKSRLQLPNEWLPRYGWKVDATDLAAWAESVGRPLPPAMNHAEGGAECFLVDAYRD